MPTKRATKNTKSQRVSRINKANVEGLGLRQTKPASKNTGKK